MLITCQSKYCLNYLWLNETLHLRQKYDRPDEARPAAIANNPSPKGRYLTNDNVFSQSPSALGRTKPTAQLCRVDAHRAIHQRGVGTDLRVAMMEPRRFPPYMIRLFLQRHLGISSQHTGDFSGPGNGAQIRVLDLSLLQISEIHAFPVALLVSKSAVEDPAEHA